MGNSNSFFKTHLKIGLSILYFVLLFSCGKTNQITDSLPASITKVAVIATQAIDYTSGAHSIVSYSAPRTVINDLLSTGSDLRMFSFGKYFYRIERRNSNTIAKFSIENPSKPIWNFSTDELGDTNSNPYAIVFLNDTKAYLLRYNSTKAWIVNPSATVQSEFKIGELDLSAYKDADGSPDMASGLIIGDKLFIALQRYDMVAGPINKSYLVVFDTNTDTKITDIELAIRNPAGKIKYYDGYIYVPGNDNFWAGSAVYGGIQRINASTYVADPTIIAPNKNISNVEISFSTKGYFVVSSGWDTNYRTISSLKSFNPETGVIATNNVAQIGDTNDRSINDVITDNSGMLWVADGSLNGGIYIIDTTTDTIQEGPIYTNLNPLEIAFCEL